jgi:hypothetical protein
VIIACHKDNFFRAVFSQVLANECCFNPRGVGVARQGPEQGTAITLAARIFNSRIRLRPQEVWRAAYQYIWGVARLLKLRCCHNPGAKLITA